MAGKFGAVDPVGNADSQSRATAVEQWQESMLRAKLKRITLTGMSEEKNVNKGDLEQRVRNG